MMYWAKLLVTFTTLTSISFWLQGCSGDDDDDNGGSQVVSTTTADDHDHDHDDDHNHSHPEEPDHSHPECPVPMEPWIPGVMPGMGKPKIILGQDIDWPPYAYLGVPPDSDYHTEGFGRDIAMGLPSVCDIEVHVQEMKWSECWGDGTIGNGVQMGEIHGCMTYTHTFGSRNRFCDFSAPILNDNKPAGLLVRLDANGNPEIDGNSDLSGKVVVDVVGWAPTADTLALAENKCTKQRFSDFTLIKPPTTSDNANNDALATMMNGTADAVWLYADQVKNYQCGAGITANWDCDLWAGFGTTFAYIQTGLFGHAQAGTTLALSKKGSGLAKILDPCIEKFLKTQDYYDICVKHNMVSSCFPNEFFPNANSTALTWELPTDQLTTTCADGYCPCPA